MSSIEDSEIFLFVHPAVPGYLANSWPRGEHDDKESGTARKGRSSPEVCVLSLAKHCGRKRQTRVWAGGSKQPRIEGCSGRGAVSVVGLPRLVCPQGILRGEAAWHGTKRSSCASLMDPE